MREILDELLGVWHSGRTGALATLVRTFGPTPVPIGSAMLVDPEGRVHGSVSDGCYEGAIYDAAVHSARTGRKELQRFDPSSAVDSADCGTIDVFVEPFSRDEFPEFITIAQDLGGHKPVTVFTVVWHSDPTVIGQHLVTDRRHNTELVALPESDVFCCSYAAAPRLIIFGANAFAAALATQGKLLGYRVTICDARESFAKQSFSGAEVVVDWPHHYLSAQSAAGMIDYRTALVTVTQDPKFEIPLLTTALRLPEFGYLGALGVEPVHSQRMGVLHNSGFDAESLARLYSPAGLDLGAGTPMETAICIASEILAVRSRTPSHHTGPFPAFLTP